MTQDHGLVLHSRRYRENSRIVEFITQQHGRVALVARIPAKKGGREMGALQPFTDLLLNWRGKSELQNLVSVDIVQKYALNGLNSYCGLYCNELLLYLSVKHEPVPALFEQYRYAIRALQTKENPAQILRQFELELIELLGYGLDFGFDTLTSDPLSQENDCFFHPDSGFTQLSQASDSLPVSCQVLDALKRKDFTQPDTLRSAKLIFASILQRLLDTRELKSRKLLQSYLKYKR